MTKQRGNGTVDACAPDLVVVDGGKGQGKLTGKQSAYVRAILKGANQSDAYREAYNAENMSDQAIWTEAGRLFRHPEVSRRITAGRAAQERQAVHSGASLRLHIEKRLFFLTENADSDANRLKALDLLGRTEKVGMFVERRAEVADNQTPEEVEAELVSKLQAAFGEAG
jgi:phage terminase small subunit